MKRCLSKTRLEIKGTGLEGEDLSEKKQLLEDITEKFEESKRRSKADTKKKTVYIESSKNEKKAMEIFGETKNVRCKTKVTLGIKTE